MAWSFILAAILNVLAFCIVFMAVAFTCYKILNPYRSLSTYPAFKISPLTCCWMWLKFYKSSAGTVASAYFFQFICGISRLFQSDDLFIFRILFYPTFVLSKHNAVQAFINSSATHDKCVEYKLAEPWIGQGLATSNGEKWRKNRKLVAPAFHTKTLQDYISVFNLQSSILITNLKGLLSEPWIDIQSLISLCSLDIICETALGVRIGAQTESEESTKYIESVTEMTNSIMNRGIKPWTYSDFIFSLTHAGREQRKLADSLHNFSRKVIIKRKESILSGMTTFSSEESNKGSDHTHRDFLQILLEHHLRDPSFTLEDIREEVDTLIFGGYETISVTLSWLLVLLGLNPDVQEKVFQELDSVFESDPTKIVSSDDISRLQYLECVINETLRLYPPGPIVGRNVKEDLKIGKYTIPAGSTVIIFIYMLHRDPEIFPNPEKFDPNRFLPENKEKIPSHCFIPFSTTPRICVGHKFAMMEMKIILSYILRNFHITALDQRDQIILKYSISIHPVQPLRIKLTAR